MTACCPADSGAAAAAVAVLGAVADIEHRAVQPHLDAAWTLLWAASGEPQLQPQLQCHMVTNAAHVISMHTASE